MTQALNLANFANNLNTSGATSNAGLQNSSVTVTAGTGLSGGGAVSLGGSVSLANAGVTSVVAGTGISVSGATGAVTISSAGASGTVTSIATGNGLAGGTITTSGTLTLGSVAARSIGSYAQTKIPDVTNYSTGNTIVIGSTFSGSWVTNYTYYTADRTCNAWINNPTNPSLSGTWMFVGGVSTGNYIMSVRIA